MSMVLTSPDQSTRNKEKGAFFKMSFFIQKILKKSDQLGWILDRGKLVPRHPPEWHFTYSLFVAML